MGGMLRPGYAGSGRARPGAAYDPYHRPNRQRQHGGLHRTPQRHHEQTEGDEGPDREVTDRRDPATGGKQGEHNQRQPSHRKPEASNLEEVVAVTELGDVGLANHVEGQVATGVRSPARCRSRSTASGAPRRLAAPGRAGPRAHGPRRPGRRPVLEHAQRLGLHGRFTTRPAGGNAGPVSTRVKARSTRRSSGNGY